MNDWVGCVPRQETGPVFDQWGPFPGPRPDHDHRPDSLDSTADVWHGEKPTYLGSLKAVLDKASSSNHSST